MKAAGERANGPNARHVVWSAVVVGFVLRAAFGLGYWTDKPLTHDEEEYVLLARNIAHGHGFTYAAPGETPEQNVERFGRVPLYPMFLAAVSPEVRGTGTIAVVPASIKSAQAAVGALGVWLLALLAGRAAGARAGAWAAVIGACYPPLVWICAYALSEAFYSVLALASAWYLGRVTDDAAAARGVGSAAAGGAFGGLATLTRPATMFFLPLACVWLVWRRRYAAAVAVVGGLALVVVPWMARNAATYGRLSLASQGGVTFWTGNNHLARGEGDMAANPDIKLANIELRRRHAGLTAEQLEPIYYREALSDIAAAPGRWIVLLAKKFFYTWVPIGPSYRLHSPLYYSASVVSYGLLLPIAIAGFILLWRRPVRPIALWLLAASAVLVCLVFFPQERFRLPIIDPALVVCAAAWASARPRAVARSA